MSNNGNNPRTYTVVASDGVIYISSLLISKLMKEPHNDTLERILNARKDWQKEAPRRSFLEIESELDNHFAYEMLLFSEDTVLETFNLTEEAVLYLELPLKVESKILDLFDQHRESFPDHR